MEEHLASPVIGRPTMHTDLKDHARCSKSSVPLYFYCNKKVMSWLIAGKERRMPGPTHWLYLNVYSQLLVVGSSHCLQRDSSIPLFPRALRHCLEMENKCPLHSWGNLDSNCGRYFALVNANCYWCYNVH